MLDSQICVSLQRGVGQDYLELAKKKGNKQERLFRSREDCFEVDSYARCRQCGHVFWSLAGLNGIVQELCATCRRQKERDDRQRYYRKKMKTMAQK